MNIAVRYSAVQVTDAAVLVQVLREPCVCQAWSAPSSLPVIHHKSCHISHVMSSHMSRIISHMPRVPPASRLLAWTVRESCEHAPHESCQPNSITHTPPVLDYQPQPADILQCQVYCINTVSGVLQKFMSGVLYTLPLVGLVIWNDPEHTAMASLKSKNCVQQGTSSTIPTCSLPACLALPTRGSSPSSSPTCCSLAHLPTHPPLLSSPLPYHYIIAVHLGTGHQERKQGWPDARSGVAHPKLVEKTTSAQSLDDPLTTPLHPRLLLLLTKPTALNRRRQWRLALLAAVAAA